MKQGEIEQALDLLAKLFISPGDTVLLSAPAYLGAIQALEVYEPEYANLDDTTAKPGSARLAYVVPDFSNPSGECLDTDQRHRLLDRVAACNVPLIEDAAYESLRYDGTHQPSLQSLDIARTGGIDQSRVIYCGTFSKTIAPGLRVGWICAAREVVHKVVLTRQAADLHGSHLDQMILHRVVSRGFAAQVQKILPVYRERRDLMLAALERYMPEGVSWVRPEGGMFIWLTLPEGLDSRELLQVSLASEGIIFVPGSSFFTDGGGGRHIRLNYTKASPAIIEDGIRRLGALITRQLTDAPVPIEAEPAIPVM